MNRLSRLTRVVLLGLVASCGAPEEAPDPSTSEAAISANITKPPMGWNSWNTFAQAIDYNVIKAQADAMVSSGMKDAGYEYINLDAGWWLGTRDSQGNITVDQSKWPGGMRAIADYIHSKGLKAGIYTDAGRNGCIYWWPTNGPPGPGTGAEGHYDQDFLAFSQWGFDYVKVDWCGGRDEGLNARNSYTAISQAIDRATAQTGRPMVLSVCEWGDNQPWNWAPAISSLWRTSADIIFFGENASMDRVLRNFDSALHPEAQSQGHYNDPDMLVAGMNGFNAAQNRTHMALWSILSAPLIAGNNLATMSAETRAILTNRDMIAINNDPLARIPTKVSEATTGRQVYSKVLSGTGQRAVLLLNRATSAGSITVRWSDLGLTSGSARVKNVWTGQDLGTIATSYSVSVPARDSVFLLVSDASSSTYALTVTRNGTGSGTVAGGPINCGSTCSANLASGTAVTLTATPASGSTFGGWSGACTGSGSCIVTMTAARAVTATFNGPPVTGAVSINAGGAANGTFVADTGFSGGSTYSVTTAIDTSQLTGTIPAQAVLQTERYGEFTYTVGGFTAGSAQAVTLYFAEVYWSAAGQRTFNVAINGATVLSAFDIFSAAGGRARAISRTFNTTANTSGQVVIQFTRAGGPDNPKVCAITVAPAGPTTQYTLSVSKAGTGSGTVSGASINCGATCSATYDSGTTVTLTATPASGSTFGGWSGACTGSGTCSVTMTAARSVTATFNQSGGTGFTNYRIVGVASQRCVDINNNTTANGTQAQIWDCNGGTNQSWTYDANQYLVVYGNKCLQASNGGTSAGTAVVIGDCTGQASQRWNVNTSGSITNVQSGLCMDVNGAGTANGTKIILWTCHGGTNQQWNPRSN